MVEKTYKPDVRWRRSVYIPDLTKGNQVMLMFVATDSAATATAGTWVEAAVDDIEILELGNGATVGVNDISALASTIYPNPAQNTLTIQTVGEGMLHYQIGNALGEIYMQGTKSNTQRLPLNVSALPNGIYFLRLQMNGKTSTHRFVINR